jgi:integrase
MKTKHAPYSLYKKRVGEKWYWYVRFWDAQKRKYAIHRATGIEVGGLRERRGEAERSANEMLGAVVFNASGMTLAAYLKAFWDGESPYFREREKVKGRKFSDNYAKAARTLIRLHIEAYPPFASLPASALTRSLVRDFMLWEAERGVSGARINRAVQALRVPVRYAVEKGEIAADPFVRLSPAAEKAKVRGVLTREEAARLVNAPVKIRRRRLAVLFGLLAGMREGEVRGLHWEDIGENAISVRHNWQDGDGLKEPKCGSFRTVFLDDALRGILEEYRMEQGGPDSGLVFSREKDGKPLCASFFRKAFIAELEAAGIPGEWNSRKPAPDGYVNEQGRRNLSFHSLRHTFVSLSRYAGINDFQIMGLVGHRCSSMMDRYSHPAEMVETEKIKKIFENLALKRT